MFNFKNITWRYAYDFSGDGYEAMVFDSDIPQEALVDWYCSITGMPKPLYIEFELQKIKVLSRIDLQEREFLTLSCADEVFSTTRVEDLPLFFSLFGEEESWVGMNLSEEEEEIETTEVMGVDGSRITLT